MPLLSDYLSDPSLIIGFRATHRTLGSGTVIDIVRESAGHDYVWVQFDKDKNALQFAADIFLDRWSGYSYFTHKVDSILKLDRDLKSLLSVLRKPATSPMRSNLPILGESDYRLCFAWAGHPPNQVRNPDAASLIRAIGYYETCRLMSARVAELTAIRYYNALGHNVEDISITQQNSAPIDQRWKTYDLLVDGRPVDVKNARKSFSSANGFVEHCVPRFKHDRVSNTEVSILGVLSDYMKTDQIENGKGECVILGEVSVGEIRKLYRWIKKRFGNLIDLTGLWRPEYQPGWAFEYSSDFYRNRTSCIDQIKDVIQAMIRNGVEPNDFPGWLLALCPAKTPFIESSLSPTKQAILNDLYDLRENVGYSRPALFVYSMAYILEAIAQKNLWHDSALILNRMIFIVDHKQSDGPSPLGLADPLRYVASLFRVFEQVFEKIQEDGIEFSGFKLQHPSILKGKAISGEWVTLLAYCGGWRELPFKVKCGNTPLYFGMHETCISCGHLICDKCGYCAVDCELLNARQEAVRQSELKAVPSIRHDVENDY